MVKCVSCNLGAKVKVAKTQEFKCVSCFLNWFENDVHETINQTQIFSKDEKIALGVSGGKDSTVLAFILNKLNQKYNYGLNIVLICIDEGIKGYRDDSIREAKKTQIDLNLPMEILSYKSLYGWSMDEIVSRIGKKNNCTFCGVFRRQALDRGAMKVKAQKLITGHNADDLAETILMNILRGDIARLERMTAPITPGEIASNEKGVGALPRVKPLRYSYEKDIVMYAHFQKLNYFSTECIYSPNAYRGNARTLIKNLERERPQVIMDLIRSGESIQAKKDVKIKLPVLRKCDNCGYISSQQFCKACLLLYGLNNNDYTIGISSKKKKTPVKLMIESEVISNKKCVCNQIENEEKLSESVKNIDLKENQNKNCSCLSNSICF